MDTTLNVANAWQRLRRQSLLPTRNAEGEDRDASVDEPVKDAGETMPMLYRSEAFAEDLFDSHPLQVCTGG